MAQSGIVWSVPPTALNPAIAAYGNKIEAAVVMIADTMAAQMEAYAKENAPWTDRTAHARKGLRGLVDDSARDVVMLYLTGMMSYQIFLETRSAGKYAIILPTMEAHYSELVQMLKAIFK